jgi:uncharacterized protein (DUF1330 family)
MASAGGSQPQEETEPPALLIIQGRLRPGAEDVYQRYLESIRPLLKKYGAQIVAVGPGLPSVHATDCWPQNDILRFPSEDALRRFFVDPLYLQIKTLYRDPAYEELGLSVFRSRPPREVWEK